MVRNMLFFLSSFVRSFVHSFYLSFFFSAYFRSLIYMFLCLLPFLSVPLSLSRARVFYAFAFVFPFFFRYYCFFSCFCMCDMHSHRRYLGPHPILPSRVFARFFALPRPASVIRSFDRSSVRHPRFPTITIFAFQLVWPCPWCASTNENEVVIAWLVVCVCVWLILDELVISEQQQPQR